MYLLQILISVFLGCDGIFTNETVTRRSKIVGVVGDVRRDMEGHHYAEKCSVFGISAEELKVLHRSFKCLEVRSNCDICDNFKPGDFW